MGTRADFYVGRGKDAEWLGSIAWNGHPDSIDENVLKAASEDAFRAAVSYLISIRDDGTAPDAGWPWPWADSGTTDYAYAYDGGKVHGSCFGGGWFDPLKWPKCGEGDDRKRASFPDMTARQKVTLGRRSGIILFGGDTE